MSPALNGSPSLGRNTDFSVKDSVSKSSEPQVLGETVTTRILMVDDSDVYRYTLCSILERYPEFEIIGQCTDGSQVIPFLEKNPVDVILMDVDMPTLNGKITTALVSKQFPCVKVIGLSLELGSYIENAMKKAGAASFLSKSESFPKLLQAIRD